MDPRVFSGDPALERGSGIDGNWGAEIVDELAPQPQDYVVKKTLYSSFVNTDLDVILRRKGIRYLFLTGIGTPTCVDATARDAYFHEYWPIVVSDCCGAILPETHEQALFHIKRRYGWVTSSEDLLTSLLSVSAKA
jgi:ureidoacrylate peracid hydrolase